MNRLVDPPVLHVVSKGPSQPAGQFHLCGFVESSVDNRRGFDFEDCGAQAAEFGSQRNKHRCNLGARGPGLIVLQQGIIYVALPRQRLTLFAFERNHPLKRWCKSSKVVTLARRGPDALSLGRQPGNFCREACGYFRGTVKAAADVAQLCLAHIVQPFGCRAFQPVAHTWICFARVQHAFQCRNFQRPLRSGTLWHHGFLIPFQTPCNGRKRLCLSGEFQKLIVG